MAESTRLTIRSHNLNGFDNSREYLLEECKSNAFSILAMQEHWLRPSFKKDKGVNSTKILHPDYDAYSTSAMSGHARSGLIRGRPYGGTGFLFHRSLSKCLRARIDVKHERITVLEISSDKHSILLINAYMPYYMTGNNENQLIEYRETLAVIQDLMMSHPLHKFILLMDLNCNIFNITHPYATMILDFMNFTLFHLFLSWIILIKIESTLGLT